MMNTELQRALMRIPELACIHFPSYPPEKVQLLFSSEEALERFIGLLDSYTEVFGDEEANFLFERGWEYVEEEWKSGGEKKRLWGITVKRRLLEKCVEAVIAYSSAVCENGTWILPLRGEMYTFTPHFSILGVQHFLRPIGEYQGFP